MKEMDDRLKEARACAASQASSAGGSEKAANTGSDGAKKPAAKQRHLPSKSYVYHFDFVVGSLMVCLCETFNC